MGLCATAVWAAGPEVAVIRFDGPVIEKPQGDLGLHLGIEPDTLRDIVHRFEKAKNDDNVKAVLITFGRAAIGTAQIEEIRKAMQDVGKPVYVHADSLDTGLYLLASAASHINMTPTGDLWVIGIHAEAPYLRNLLDKIHVAPDFVHIGDYKSAGETLYRTGPSEDAEANMNWLLDGLYGSILEQIAKSRFNGDVEKVRGLVNLAPYTAEEGLKLGLIDSVEHIQQLSEELKGKYGQDLTFVRDYGAKSEIPEIDFTNPLVGFMQLLEQLTSGPKEQEKTSIAIVYVEGMIVPGEEEPSLFGSSSGAWSTTIRRALDKAANDDSVKAVVLRVDSPGGSALASEVIYYATQRVRDRGKPLVVSMGNVAASGGYYVSCGADYIYADDMTITASIGVLGGKLVTTGMWDAIGVNWFQYNRGDNSDIMTTAHKWSDDDRQRITNWMEQVYGVFKGHIRDHRKDKLAQPLDEVAGGRVYTGQQALKRGLVDGIGTLDDAVAKAAGLAGITTYELRVMPRPKTLFDLIREGMGPHDTKEIEAGAFRRSLLGPDSPFSQALLDAVRRLDPQRARAFTQAVMRLDLIEQEGVITMMPEDFIVRFR